MPDTSLTKSSFEQTKHKVTIDGLDRPVLKLGKRLFAGDMLSWLNQHGWPGQVWSAMTLDQLQYNIDQSGRRHGTGSAAPRSSQ